MSQQLLKQLDTEIMALYAKRRPLTTALRLGADIEKSEELHYIDEQIDELELEYERVDRQVHGMNVEASKQDDLWEWLESLRVVLADMTGLGTVGPRQLAHAIDLHCKKVVDARLISMGLLAKTDKKETT